MTNEELHLRPNVDHGLWCVILIPISLLASCYRNSETGIYVSIFTLSIILSVQFYNRAIALIENAPDHSQTKVYIAAICGAFILYYFTDYRLMVIALTILAAHKIFETLFDTILSKCSESFTLGEISIVAQSTTLFIISCLLGIEEERRKGIMSPSELEQCTKFSQVLLFGCLAVIFSLLRFPFWRPFHRFYIFCSFVGIGMIVAWSLYLGRNPVIWLARVCTKSHRRLILIMSWIGLVLASVFFVSLFNKIASAPKPTIVRKFFHIVIISTYVPGFLFDVQFLYLASAVALAVFVVFETARVLEIPPLGSAIKDAFTVFVDEKDTGILVLSHIYLLVGCSCPLWLFPPQNGLHSSHWSGIVSVGLGDMVASAAGSTFGWHKWSGSKKTLEGTFCAIVAQSVALCAILHWGHMLTFANIALVTTAAVVTSITEAKTEQNDNLILPFVMFPFLSFVN